MRTLPAAEPAVKSRGRWSNPRRWPTSRQVLAGAVGLVVLQLVVRAGVAFSGGFYWDDLILVSRSGRFPLLSGEFLFYDHDGHFMPAAFLVAWLSTAVAPLDWAVPALTLVAFQALASLAVLRVLRLLLGTRPVLLLPLTFYLFAPLTLPSFAWWAAALNALPLQVALAWVAGDAVKLCRTGRLRFAVSGTVVAAVAAAFFEKAALVPFVAFATVALMYRVDGIGRPLRDAWSRGRALWIPLCVLLGGWAAAYLAVTESRLVSPSSAQTEGLIRHGVSSGLVPTLLGGPWTWERWHPSPPWATPPPVLVVLGWVAVAAALVWSLRSRKRTGWVWVAMVAYVAASVLAMVLTRSGADTAYELAQTLRYFADSAVVLAIGWALILRAPHRARGKPLPTVPPVARSLPVVLLVLLFVTSSLWSTVTFVQRWRDNPTVDYLDNARTALAAEPDIPLLDQPVSLYVLLPVVFPYNTTSHVFGPLRDRPDFADSTSRLRLLDDSGRFVPATVFPTRNIGQGPVPGCGYLVENDPVELPLDGPLIDWDWTVGLNYFASRAGAVEMSLGDGGNGDVVTVPVSAGLNQAFVRISGAGEAVRVRATTPGSAVCIGAGPVGPVAPVS